MHYQLPACVWKWNPLSIPASSFVKQKHKERSRDGRGFWFSCNFINPHSKSICAYDNTIMQHKKCAKPCFLTDPEIPNIILILAFKCYVPLLCSVNVMFRARPAASERAARAESWERECFTGCASRGTCFKLARRFTCCACFKLLTLLAAYVSSCRKQNSECMSMLCSSVPCVYMHDALL